MKNRLVADNQLAYPESLITGDEPITSRIVYDMVYVKVIEISYKEYELNFKPKGLYRGPVEGYLGPRYIYGRCPDEKGFYPLKLELKDFPSVIFPDSLFKQLMKEHEQVSGGDLQIYAAVLETRIGNMQFNYKHLKDQHIYNYDGTVHCFTLNSYIRMRTAEEKERNNLNFREYEKVNKGLITNEERTNYIKSKTAMNWEDRTDNIQLNKK